MNSITTKKKWEPLFFRPQLPKGWQVFEQRGSVAYEETDFIRWGKVHHNGQPQRVWVLFNEFNMDHPDYRGNSYQYTVKGGDFVQPDTHLRYFSKLKDAENYMIYLMECTDRWIEQINSPEYIEAYNQKIKERVKAAKR